MTNKNNGFRPPSPGKTYTMLQKTTLDFLKKLKANNKKEWFDTNRSAYETARKDFTSFLELLVPELSGFDNSLKGLEAKKCVFRINRDIRFSNDKTPYKTNFGASISPGGKKSMTPGYYIHIEPGKSFLAGGVYMPEAPILAAIRQEIDYNAKEFKKILAAKEFVKYFGGIADEGKLRTAPKGYAKDHPQIELLKNKHFIVVHNFKDDKIHSKDFVKYCLAVFKAMYPFDLFLRRAIV